MWHVWGWEEEAGWWEAEAVGWQEVVGWEEEAGWEEEVHLEGCSRSTSGRCCTVLYREVLPFTYLVLPKALVLHRPSVLIKPRVLPKIPVVRKHLVLPKHPVLLKHLVPPKHPVLLRHPVLTKYPVPPACLTVSLRLLLPPGLTLLRLVMAGAGTSLLVWLAPLRLRVTRDSVMCMQGDDAAATVPDARCMGVAEVLRGCCGCCTHRVCIAPGRVRGCVSSVAAAGSTCRQRVLACFQGEELVGWVDGRTACAWQAGCEGA